MAGTGEFHPFLVGTGVRMCCSSPERQEMDKKGKLTKWCAEDVVCVVRSVRVRSNPQKKGGENMWPRTMPKMGMEIMYLVQDSTFAMSRASNSNAKRLFRGFVHLHASQP